MSGSFACPECGGIVELEGLAPGRQVRCVFCHQLLEVPYLPRVPLGKRRGPARPKWTVWAWSAIGLALAAIVTWGSLRFWWKHQQSRQAASIHRLIASSEAQERAGHLNEALIDLDAALELVQQVPGSRPTAWVGQRKRRQDLARRDAQETLDSLMHHAPSALPLGDWLNLIARSERDPDLEPLRPPIVQGFRAMAGRQVDAELTAAQRSVHDGRVVVALQACERIAPLLEHLDPDSRRTRRRATEELVTGLLASHGVVVEPAHGSFVFGSESSYTASLVPLVVKALETQDYLPYRADSPWAESWKHAAGYRMQIQVSEQQEGNYPSTQSRVTLIRIELLLTAQGAPKWRSSPGARSRAPLPNLPAYLSGNLAAQSERSQELERLLYKDALGQVGEKVSLALTNLPACCR
jgi:hypothetical protein